MRSSLFSYFYLLTDVGDAFIAPAEIEWLTLDEIWPVSQCLRAYLAAGNKYPINNIQRALCLWYQLLFALIAAAGRLEYVFTVRVKVVDLHI